MTPREERGLVIAALCKLKKTPEGWIVPSQSGDGLYTVDPQRQTCTCPDHRERGQKCKHLYAVEFTISEVNPDGTVTDTKSLTFTEKVTYKQDWPAYNLAQSIEKDRVQELLRDLVPWSSRTGGTLRRDASRTASAMPCSRWSSRSIRRSVAAARLPICARHTNAGTRPSASGRAKVCTFMEDETYTPILKRLIVESSRPLRAIETKFAIDSSGFSSNKFERLFHHKYSVTKFRHTWVKCHVASGVKTNIVTAVRILDKDAADSPQFIPLVQRHTSTSPSAKCPPTPRTAASKT